MSGTISAARVLLMAAFLGMAVLVVSCRGNSKPSQAQLLIQSPPSAQELPLDLEALMTVEAIVPPPAVGGVSYQLGREALPAAYGLVVAVYPDAKTAARVFASPAPSKGIIGLIGPVIRAIEVESPLWDGGPMVRCFEAPITAYNPLDDTKKRECDVVFRNFIVSVGLGRPGDVPLPAMQDEVPLLQAGVQHVERVLGGSAPSPAASATPTNTGSPTPRTHAGCRQPNCRDCRHGELQARWDVRHHGRGYREGVGSRGIRQSVTGHPRYLRDRSCSHVAPSDGEHACVPTCEGALVGSNPFATPSLTHDANGANSKWSQL